MFGRKKEKKSMSYAGMGGSKRSKSKATAVRKTTSKKKTR